MCWFKKKKRLQMNINSNETNSMHPNELPVPIYLNQEVVFNMIAMLEDGFSKLSTIKTLSSESETNTSKTKGSFGASNDFALLGVSFSAEKGKEKSQAGRTEVSRESVHTPASLFQKLRKRLTDRELLHTLTEAQVLEDIKTGDFIEIKVTLRKNPIQDTLGWIKSFTELFGSFEKVRGQNVQTGPTKKSQQTSTKEMTKQIDTILDMVSEKDVVELVGESIVESGIKVVVSCQNEFFSRNNPSEIVDGEFYILGKIIKIGRSEGEGINLLRKTTLGRIDQNTIGQFVSVFESLGDKGFRDVQVSAVIEPPVILVYPIAIYL